MREAIGGWSVVRRFLRDESGPTAVEYAVMLALIVLVAALSIQGIGGRVMNVYAEIDTVMPDGG